MGGVRDRPRRAGGGSRLIRCLLAAVAVGGGLGLACAPPAAAAEGQVRLARQTPWVVPGETLSLAVRTADVADPESVELAVTLYPAVKSRAELARTMLGEGLKSPVWPRANLAVPLPQVPADVDGTLAVRVPTRDARDPPDPARATLSQPGIYPVQVELRELGGGGDTLHRFITHLLSLEPPAGATRLATTVVLPLSAPPSTGLDATPPSPPARASALADAAAGLAASARVPLTLAPTPEVLVSLSASDPTTAKSLQEGLAGRDVLGRPFVPVQVPGLGSAAEALLPRHLEAGREVARTVLGRDPLQGTWLADEPLDGPSLARVVAAGSPQLVLPQAAIGPTGPGVPAPLRPVTVTGGGATAAALVADGTLASHLDPMAPAVEQPLLAHHLLADLAAIATLPADQGAPVPGKPPDPAVAAVVADRRFVPSSSFLSELLGGLVDSPVLRPVDLSTAFAVTPEPPPPPARPPSTGRPRRSTTTTAPPPAGRVLLPLPPGSAGQDISAEAAAAVLEVSSAQQVLAEPAPDEAPPDGTPPVAPRQDGGLAPPELLRRLLVATSADLTVEERRRRLGAVAERADLLLGGLKMPAGRTLRLTAKTGQLPVGIFNETGRTARVILELESDKLKFPGGNRMEVELDRRTTTTRVLVRVRASGAFPVRVRLLTPDGNRVLQETSYVVQAYTFPGVAIAVSGAAALFLAAWWAKTLTSERGQHRAPRRRWRRG